MAKIYIASDHAGFELKSKLIELFSDYDFIDLGPDSNNSVDYPDYAQAVSKAVLGDTASKGILLCGSGIGMSIAANRFNGIRAALCMNPELAALSRKHNNSNILVLAARFISEDEAKKIIQAWLDTDFEGDRHLKRIEKIDTAKI